VLLHHGSGYRIEDGYVEIIGGIRMKIIEWDRRYDQLRIERRGFSIERGR
jgi:hypothetical protein